MFFWNSLAFSMIQRMLAIWSLVPLPFLKLAWTSGSSQFTYCWRPGLEYFEHYFTSVWDEYNCVVVWAFFGIAFLWDWNENWPFPVCGHCWIFQICWHIEFSTFTASSFRIWNSSTGIPWPPLALFVVMLSKAHLTSHFRMSGSRSVITPSWLGREDLFGTVLLRSEERRVGKECDVKWAVGCFTIYKATGVMEFQLSYFKS